MDDGQRQVWDQQPNEPRAAYVRFVVFRSLGPCRSVALAAEVAASNLNAAIQTQSGPKRRKNPKKSETISIRQWYDDSSEWNWSERACAWDLHVFAESCEQVQAAMTDLMRQIACKALESIVKGSAPANWPQILQTFEVLACHAPTHNPAANLAARPEDKGKTGPRLVG